MCQEEGNRLASFTSNWLFAVAMSTKNNNDSKKMTPLKTWWRHPFLFESLSQQTQKISLFMLQKNLVSCNYNRYSV